MRQTFCGFGNGSGPGFDKMERVPKEPLLPLGERPSVLRARRGKGHDGDPEAGGLFVRGSCGADGHPRDVQDRGEGAFLQADRCGSVRCDRPVLAFDVEREAGWEPDLLPRQRPGDDGLEFGEKRCRLDHDGEAEARIRPRSREQGDDRFLAVKRALRRAQHIHGETTVEDRLGNSKILRPYFREAVADVDLFRAFLQSALEPQKILGPELVEVPDAVEPASFFQVVG